MTELPPETSQPTPPPRSKYKLPLIIIATLIIGILVGIIIGWIMYATPNINYSPEFFVTPTPTITTPTKSPSPTPATVIQIIEPGIYHNTHFNYTIQIAEDIEIKESDEGENVYIEEHQIAILETLDHFNMQKFIETKQYGSFCAADGAKASIYCTDHDIKPFINTNYQLGYINSRTFVYRQHKPEKTITQTPDTAYLFPIPNDPVHYLYLHTWDPTPENLKVLEQLAQSFHYLSD